MATPSLRPRTTWIDLTSASPLLGSELVALARERQVECLEAPVGGGIAEAGAGRLELFVGASPAAVQRQRGLLEALGTVNHVGDNGAGYTTKLLVNLLWFGQAVAIAEALLVGRRARLDLDVLRAALRRSAAASALIDRDLDALLNGDYMASFGLHRCCEELEAVRALAAELDVPFEHSALVAQTYSEALIRYGPVDGELLAVSLLEERAGLRCATAASAEGKIAARRYVEELLHTHPPEEFNGQESGRPAADVASHGDAQEGRAGRFAVSGQGGERQAAEGDHPHGR